MTSFNIGARTWASSHVKTTAIALANTSVVLSVWLFTVTLEDLTDGVRISVCVTDVTPDMIVD